MKTKQKTKKNYSSIFSVCFFLMAGLAFCLESESLPEVPDSKSVMEAVTATASIEPETEVPVSSDNSEMPEETILSVRAKDDFSSFEVNINTASSDQLMLLPGIGPGKAEAIVTYRTNFGCFSSIEDIMLVPGIKKGTYNKICQYITIEN